MTDQRSAVGGRALVELSNAMVALHRRHHGRGPGAAKSFLSDEMAVSVLCDVYTPVERTLIEAGQADHVRRTRTLHAHALAQQYRGTAEAVLGRPVAAHLSIAGMEPDVLVEIFFLEESRPA